VAAGPRAPGAAAFADTRAAGVTPELIREPGLGPASRLERAGAAAGGAANFAGATRKIFTVGDAPDAAAQKSFVTTSREAVTRQGGDFGIGVAKPAPPMSAVAVALPQLHPSSEYTDGPAAMTAATFDSAPAAPAAAADAAGAAHRAVEAVLRAVEQAVGRDQKAVNLQFSVGETELEVRIELHGGEVRTTFRTDSPELRAALSQEWQMVVSAADRPVRLAPAVFTSSDFSGDASRHREQPHAPRPTEEDSSARRSGEPSLPHAIGRTERRPAVPATSLHLHTLA
jgi:hypothetical protein